MDNGAQCNCSLLRVFIKMPFFLQDMFEAEQLNFTPADTLRTSGLVLISSVPELRGTGL